VQPCACVVGDVVERRPALTHPGLTRPVAYLDGMDLAGLVQALPSAATLGDAVAMWAKQMPAERAMAVAQWLHDRDLLDTGR